MRWALGKPSFALVFAAICLAGSLLGASVGYVIGMWGGRPVVDRLFSQDKIQFVEQKYQRYDGVGDSYRRAHTNTL